MNAIATLVTDTDNESTAVIMINVDGQLINARECAARGETYDVEWRETLAIVRMNAMVNAWINK